MDAARFHALTSRYGQLRLAVVGDYCLDRYLEIDPARAEISIETGLPVHNVVRVRAQAGAAGTVLNNLAALGIATLRVVGLCGEDGEGYELQRALHQLPGTDLTDFFPTPERCTFTYCKPLVVTPGAIPQELNRLDSKNWTPTPEGLWERLGWCVSKLGEQVDAVIVMEQVEVADTGVIGGPVRDALETLALAYPQLPMVVDSRRGVDVYRTLSGKMNGAELRALAGGEELTDAAMETTAVRLAQERGRPVFITLAERGILGATPEGEVERVPAFPVEGPIDVVGAGDSVTANLTAALAAGATLREAMELAMAGASVVVHQLGTTGTARVEDLGRKLGVF